MSLYSKENVQNLLQRRFFLSSSFDIYGGSAGLYDLGPPGSAMKAEVELMWRKMFVFAEEDMLEITGTALTPGAVFKTSGHVERFTDLMVTDIKTGDCHRADVLLEDWIDKQLGAQTKKKRLPDAEIAELESIRAAAGGMDLMELKNSLTALKVLSPEGNEISDPFPFNLMFATKLGPKSEATETHDSKDKLRSVSHGAAYLRPETAQSIFVNFRKLQEFNRGSLPFGVAQLGNAYRNEIAPRNGLLRVREFPMAEIEYFVDPKSSLYPKFPAVSHLVLPLLDSDRQLSNSPPTTELTLREAVDIKLIKKEVLAFFIGKTYEFLISLGIQTQWIRFRQHRANELAHYAEDCWDAEIYTSYGWIECVGIADRAVFDLKCHQEATGVELLANRKLETPIQINTFHVEMNRKAIGMKYPKNQKEIVAWLERLSDSQKIELKDESVKTGCVTFELPSGVSVQLDDTDHIKFSPLTKTIEQESFIPNVIEPSFGVGRILAAIWEHTYRERDAKRSYFSFPISVSPWKVSIQPLSLHQDFKPIVADLKSKLLCRSIPSKVDASGVGRPIWNYSGFSVCG
eukprot:GHVP01051510.1.p1 GENE.GHVP01051510.1~~GHVP01051510.1.p1  ORF type:complete len:573 (+),score=100.81 GHVP01051510.1:14-1732(+)